MEITVIKKFSKKHQPSAAYSLGRLEKSQTNKWLSLFSKGNCTSLQELKAGKTQGAPLSVCKLFEQYQKQTKHPLYIRLTDQKVDNWWMSRISVDNYQQRL